MRDNKERARQAMILIAMVLVLQIVVMLSTYLQLDLLNRITIDGDYTTEEADASDLREAIVSVLFAVVYIISTITYIRWFRRAYYNLHTMEDNLLYSEGWAAGAWFVPILNLFRPYQIMKELYNKTNKILKTNLDNYQNKEASNFVGIWWFVWLASSFIDNIDGRKAWKANTIEEYIESGSLSLLAGAITIPLCFLAIKVIYDYSKMESLLYSLKDIDRKPSMDYLNFDNESDILDA